MSRASSAGPRSSRPGRSASSAWRERLPELARGLGPARTRRAAARAGSRRCREFARPARSSRRATAGAEGHAGVQARSRRRWSAARPTSSSRRRRSSTAAGVFSRDARGPQHPVRHPRARDGRDRQRARAARRHRQAVRLDLPRSSPTTCGPAVRLSALMDAPGRLGLDARLDRARRGRPDAPAGRALRGAAGDPEPLVRPAGGRERDGRTPGRSRSSAQDGPVALLAHAPEGADARPRASSRRRRASSAGAYVLWETATAASPT